MFLWVVRVLNIIKALHYLLGVRLCASAVTEMPKTWLLARHECAGATTA